MWKRGLGRGIAVVLAVAMVFQVGSAAAAEESDKRAGDRLPTIHYPQKERFLDAQITELRGSREGLDGCTFRFPRLRLAPEEHRIAQRQLSVDYETCVTVLEKGIPEAGGGDTNETLGQRKVVDVAPETSPQPSGDTASAAANTMGAGYYRVWWEDVVNLRVHEVKAKMSWIYDGSCINSWYGAMEYWWLALTGWTLRWDDQWTTTTGCNYATVHGHGNFENFQFCPQGSVWSYYRDVFVTARGDGVLVGWYGSTWTTYPLACPTLHYHQELIRSY